MSAVLQTEATEAKAPQLAVSWKDGFWFFALSILGAGQIFQGTDPKFTLLVLLFSVLWLVTIRLCGGAMTLSGATVAYLGFQHVVFSQFAKLLFGQRPDTPLLEPIMTMEVYCLGMAGIMTAAIIANLPPLRRFQPILQASIPTDRLKMMAFVCTALMVLRYAGSPQLGVGGIRFLMNFEFIMPLSAAITTAWVVQESQGRKFVNWLSVVNVAAPFFIALIGFQRREAVFAGVIMVATALIFGFRFRLKHYLCGLGLIYFFQFIFFPFALYYRNMPGKTKDLSANIARSWEALTTVMSDPLAYQDEDKYSPPEFEWEVTRLLYYDRKANPTLDRMSVIIVTDALLRAANQEAPIGWRTINAGLDMWVPRAFNDDKEILGTSNEIAQKAPGLVSEVDFGTQITMGYFSEAYLSFRWAGVYFIGLVAFLVMFLIIRLTVGDQLKGNLWASAFILGVPWTTSEGTVQQLVILFGQTLPLAAALGFVLMILGNTLSRGENRQREQVDEGEVFESKDLRLAG